MAEMVFTASYHTEHRKHKINETVSPMCKRCGLAVETPLHLFYQCPCNAELSHIDSIADSDHLSLLAIQDPQHEAYWCRGIITNDLVSIDPQYSPPSNPRPQIELFRSARGTPWGSGMYYGDGSGGKHHDVSHLRRCGVSVVQVDNEGNLLRVATSALPGDAQTIPRSELFAFVLLLQQVEQESDIIYNTDHKNLYLCFPKGVNFNKASINFD